MPPPDAPSGFIQRYLDPGERLGEILFGLIMVLTFTSTARAALGDSPDAATELLIAALGCNIAWGIIDGGMYIMSAMLERAREAQAEARAHATTAIHTRVTMDDIKGAVACFWLVVVCTIPASVPFMVIDDAYLALRVSNGLLLVMLFLVGYYWGHYANTSRWIAGLVFLVVGLILVAIAIALGG
jgi:VIT1/CCC1 family predicted Fe2+/Mn2+ transporter